MRGLSLRFVPFFASLALAGCYGAHERALDAGPQPDAATCDPAARPRCTHRDAPCDPLALVDAVCVATTWQCPPGAAPYERPWQDDRCLPLRGVAFFPDGVHESPVSVPVGDSCDWIFPLETPSGVQLVGVPVAPRCDALTAPTGPLDDAHDMGSYFAVEAAIVTPSGTRLLARGWQFDATAPFGVRALGVELGHVAGGRLRFDAPVLFDETNDLGDAAIVDGGFVYAYGSPGPTHDLEEDSVVGRAPLDALDDPAAWSVLGEGGWGVGAPLRMFGSGPHRAAVVPDPRGAGFLHVYAAGFGRELRLNTAPRPEGPWTTSVLLLPCELPADDPGAYCAGPQVHRELLDPLDPGALIVSYSIGTTSEDQAERRMRDPDAYWPHVVRVRLP